MESSAIARSTLKWVAVTLATLAGIVVVLLAALTLVDANRFRGVLARYLAARTGREIRLDGPLEIHLLSFHPSLIAARVVIGNPRWMPAGTLAEIGKLSVIFELHLFPPGSGVGRLQLQDATLHLSRDATGHANWQWTNPDQGNGRGPPLIRSLLVPRAHLELEDARRHLRFAGTVSAQDLPGSGAIRPLRIEGAGQLNGRAVTFALNGDPLATVTRTKAYRFTFAERSSGSLLVGRGFLPQPFDFGRLQTTFEATGEDLKDLYFLTGVSLPNTGVYRLSGSLEREGLRFRFSELQATSGQSDMRGTLLIDTSSGEAKIDADLQSQRLRMLDLGARAAGREPADTARKRLFPDTELRFNGTRHSDAMVKFQARIFEVGRVPLHTLAGKLKIDHGILTVDALTARFAAGKLAGRFRIDATQDEPATDLDFRITDLRLGQFARKDPDAPPVDGLLQARFILKGHGSSLHQFVAGASGRAIAVLPRGTLRTSFAELTGIDLVKGLGLLFSKDNDTAVRCGVAGFEVHDGTMSAASLVLDTDPVLVTGQGEIHLDSEALDLTLHGRPKKWQLLRLRAPVSVRGTLEHPSVGIGARKTLAQAGEAVALGVVLTPVAAVLAFVDPGLAKDADCAALLAQAKSKGAPVKPAGAVRSAPDR
jgi:hypothetical protein